MTRGLCSRCASTGRTSRTRKPWCATRRLRLRPAAFSGNKYPHLFAFYEHALGARKWKRRFHGEIERLKTQDSDDELVQAPSKATLIRGLASNSGLAHGYGDWRNFW